MGILRVSAPCSTFTHLQVSYPSHFLRSHQNWTPLLLTLARRCQCLTTVTTHNPSDITLPTTAMSYGRLLRVIWPHLCINRVYSRRSRDICSRPCGAQRVQ